jgi:predicted metal-dependent RNase
VVLPIVSAVELGLRLMDTRAAVTVKVVVALTEPDAPVIVLAPSPMLVARPVFDTVATLAADDVHATEFVRFCVLPSL